MIVTSFYKNFNPFGGFATKAILVSAAFFFATACGKKEAPLPGTESNDQNRVEAETTTLQNASQARGGKKNPALKKNSEGQPQTKLSSNSVPDNNASHSKPNVEISEPRDNRHAAPNDNRNNQELLDLKEKLKQPIGLKPAPASTSETEEGDKRGNPGVKTTSAPAPAPLLAIDELIVYFEGLSGKKNSKAIKAEIASKVDEFITSSRSELSTNYNPKLLELMIERLPKTKPENVDEYTGPIRRIVVVLGQTNKAALNGVPDKIKSRSKTAYSDLVNFVEHYRKA